MTETWTSAVKGNFSWPDRMSATERQQPRMFCNAAPPHVPESTAEKALRESEERYRSVVENIQEVLFHIDETGSLTFLNPAWTTITGFSVESSVGKPFTEFVHPDVVAQAWDYFRQIMGGNLSNLPSEIRVRTKAGDWHWMELRASLHQDASNATVGVFGTLGDINDQKQHQDALLRMVSLLTSTIESTADGILAVDLAGSIISYNERFWSLLGETSQVWVHQHNACILPQIASMLSEPAVLESRISDIDRNPEWTGTDRVSLVDGRIFEVFSQPQWLNREVTGRVWSFRDVTERENAVEDLKLQREFLRSIIDTDPNLIFIKDEQGVFQLVNQAYADAYGTSIEAMVGKSIQQFNFNADEIEVFMRTDHEVLKSLQGRFIPEVKMTNVHGETRWLQTHKRPIYSPDKRTYHVLGIATDITERKRFEQELAHQALHDRLTGLPNRALLMDRLERALGETQRTGVAIAVLTLDLDNFKVVNDSLGHHVGDQLLVEMASRLSTCVYSGDTVARLGGDEFTVVLEQIKDLGHAVSVADKISVALQRVVNLAGHEILPTISIGLAFCHNDGITPQIALRNADTAMYQAKTSGRAGYAVYDPLMNRIAIERLELQADLHRAIERDELKLHYQPIVHLSTGEVVGIEALLRWDHPRHGMISPGDFIPIAEETGLIVPIGDWVLREACLQTAQWQQRYPHLAHLTVSVNVSLYQLNQEEFVGRACQIIAQTGIAPSSVKLEITESVMMRDVETMIERLVALKSYGLKLAIDDFGTGYSCMAYLIRLPIDTIKIDRIFVSRLGDRPEDDAVLQSIVHLAKALNLDIVSEGIETRLQLAQLQRLGSHCGQGFLFARPLASQDMDQLLEKRQNLLEEQA
jgi:diguanylate cyclase (GGDEF)-like protein/PAS domain S-box-containing protein